MGLADIINSVLEYPFSVDVGGGDFALGVTVVGVVALITAGYLWSKYGHNVPFVGKK